MKEYQDLIGTPAAAKIIDNKEEIIDMNYKDNTLSSNPPTFLLLSYYHQRPPRFATVRRVLRH